MKVITERKYFGKALEVLRSVDPTIKIEIIGTKTSKEEYGADLTINGKMFFLNSFIAKRLLSKHGEDLASFYISESLLYGNSFKKFYKENFEIEQ